MSEALAPLRVVVTGGRHYDDATVVRHMLDPLGEEFGIALIAHGGATGADTLAADYCREHRIPERVFPADWRAHGRAAGPRRNTQMLDEVRPDIVVAFPGGRGTADCVRQATARRIPVLSPPEEDA